MSREKIFKALFALLVGLLLLLLFRLRPGIEGPRTLEKPRIVDGSAVLSGKDFRYEVKEKGELKYVVTAEKVVEKSRDEKELSRPSVIIPKGGEKNDTITAEKGFFSSSGRELRVFGNATISLYDGASVSSSGFRVTPQEEVVSEGEATFRKGTLEGRGDQLRYDRERRTAYLEGAVSFRDSGLSFSAKRITLDLSSHSGKLEGPVEAVKDDLRIVAPEGSITLAPDNSLERITLFPSVSGENSSSTFSASSGQIAFGRGGGVEGVALIGRALLVQKGPEPGRLETGELFFSRSGGSPWGWSAPGRMRFLRQGMNVEAAKGSGTVRDGLLLGDLGGPVRGWDGKTELSSASGRISEEGFELVGNAQAVQDSGTIEADRIVLGKNGGKKAFGSVRGNRAVSGSEALSFSCAEAGVAPSGYPVKLRGAASVRSERYEVKSPEITLVTATGFRACGGVAAALEGDRDRVFVYGSDAEYDSSAGLVTVTGNPSATDGERKISASERITASIGADRRAEEIVAEGGARYESGSSTASGDRIAYSPKEKKGEVYSAKGRAEVVQMDPYKRATGRKITFGDKELGIRGEDGEHHRGKIEGAEELKKENGERPVGDKGP